MFDVNKLQVAKPCNIGWETMSGDERTRLCSACKLNVYNLSGMTVSEAEHLIEAREGRVCIRMVRRLDGTVLTKDCPVGLRKYRLRTARFAGAALAAILGVFSVSYGQKKTTLDASSVKIVRTRTNSQMGTIKGVVLDPNGAVIPGVRLYLINGSEKRSKTRRETRTSDSGNFIFNDVAPGEKYTVETADKVYGSIPTRIENLTIVSGEQMEMIIHLSNSGEDVTIGILAEEPLIDMSSSTVQTTITADRIRRIQH